MTYYRKTLALLLLLTVSLLLPAQGLALASNNIPLDSPIYFYLEKLSGYGLLDSDIKGLKPYSKAEATRLLLEAEGNLTRFGAEAPVFASELMLRMRELLSREVLLRDEPDKAPVVDFDLLSALRLRYVFLDGIPRDYKRDVLDSGHQSAFGFIGGDLRPVGPSIEHQVGSEGTPLTENNEGIIYNRGNNVDLRWVMEGYAGSKFSLLFEPIFLHTPEHDSLALQKGYLKLGGGGLELEVGRDANWFGPGFRGALTLTNNAENFNLIKISSPEPLDVGWVKEHLGDLKYSVILSRFDETGTGKDLRQPTFIGIKLALKPNSWFEIGGNFVRQKGGPGHEGEKTSFQDLIFGGGDTDKSNTIAGIDLRFRIPWLRNTEIFGEYAGEDSALFWPFVESYVAGIFIPRLTADGRNDLRFEYFWGNEILYIDHNFPTAGYTFHGMTPGHSQGGATQDIFVRYSHWFSVRNNLALEYFRTDRGREGRVAGQVMESKHAGRISWVLPLYAEVDAQIGYGIERISNLNLVDGVGRTNQRLSFELRYQY